MVSTTTETINPMPLFSVSPSKLTKLTGDSFLQSISSSLFNLSKPFNLSQKLKTDSNDYTSNAYSNTTFTFPEPFESCHLAGGGGKLVNKTSSKRSQPYSLSKPKISNKPAAEENTLFPNGSSDSVSLDTSQQPQPNAILSRLSNISNTFKSIFVRPKHTKPVDLDSFNKRTNNQTSSSHNQSTNEQTDATKFKINLFSVSSNRPDNTIDELTTNPSYDMNQKLEKIISRNVMMESYTNKLNKQIPSQQKSYENGSTPVLSTLKKGARGSDSSSTISSMSSAQSSTDPESSKHETVVRASQSTSQHQRALFMSNNSNIIKTEVTVPKQPVKNLNNTISGPISKWTCMICLSKHTADIEICLICGSNNTDTANKKVQISFNQSKNMSYDFKQKNFPNETIHEFSSPLRSLGNGNSQKTWICGYCTFANDNLKIVCMNCRASKQKNSNASGARLSHQSLQMKRKPVSKQLVNHKNQLNRSNEENENTSDGEDRRGRSSKRSKTNDADQTNLCNNCKSCNLAPPSVETQAKTPTGQCGANSSKCDNRKSLETPLRPKCFVETPAVESDEARNKPANPSITVAENNQPKDTSAAKDDTTVRPNALLTKMLGNSNKWSCESCLVSNDSDKTVCACCSAKKPSTAVEPAKKTNGLFAVAASNASKWSCSTCLASNDSSKDTCACCMTKRFTESSNKPANSLFAAAAKSNSNKWSCSTCLASNDSAKDACACCMTKRPGGVAEKTDAPKTGLFAAASKSSGDKWECSSCLVKNESSSSTCACCSAAKPGSSSTEPTKTKFASLVAAAGTLNTSNISFGLKPSSETTNAAPISFGTSNLTASAGDSGKISFGMSNPPSFGTTQLSFGTSDATSKPNPSSSMTFGKPAEEAKPEAPSTTSLFGNSTATSASKPLTFGSTASAEPTPTPSSFLQISNPFSNQQQPAAQTIEPQQKPVETQPKLFGFQSTNSPAPVKNEFIKTEAPKSLFGSSTVTESAKPSFGGFGNTTIQETKSEVAKPAFGFGSEPPKQGLFGSSSTTTASTTDKPAFGSSKTESTSLFGCPAKTPSLFGSSQPTPSATPSFGTSTEPSKPAASSVFTFGGAQPAAASPATNFFGAKPAATTTPAFGSTPTIPTTDPATPNSNVFGQLNQNTASTKQSFNFGQSQSVNTTPAVPFQFGGASNSSQEKFGAPAKKQANDENKPLAFNFGSANTNTGFNFGGQTDSPLKVKSVTNQAPASSPFVFGGAPANSQSAEPANLTQILAGPPTTPSTAGRPMRKATRMRKK